MTLEKLNKTQEYLSHNFDKSDFRYCDEQATELVKMQLKDEDGNPVTNDEGNPMTFSDWWTIVARYRAKVIERVRGMMCAEIGEE